MIDMKMTTPNRASTSAKTTTQDGKGIDILPQSPVNKSKPVQCWALTHSGKRCQKIVKKREGEAIPIPYCNLHLKAGDHALKVVNHPLAGKCLVARFDLPPKYRMAFHGIRGRCATSDKEDRSISYYPPNPATGSNYYPSTRSLRVDNYNGVLNPKDTCDVLQYAACPGPTERQNCRSTFRYFGKRNGKLGGLEFLTLEAIPKTTLILHWYGSGWWSARDIKRTDIGSKKYPAPKRRKRVKKEDTY